MHALPRNYHEARAARKVAGSASLGRACLPENGNGLVGFAAMASGAPFVLVHVVPIVFRGLLEVLLEEGHLLFAPGEVSAEILALE